MLRDIAKILVGATATEMGWNIWLLAENMTPVQFLGLTFGFGAIMAAVLINFTFLIIAIYFAWFRKSKKKSIQGGQEKQEIENLPQQSQKSK